MKINCEKRKISDIVKVVNDTTKDFIGTRRYLTTGLLEGNQILGWDDVSYLNKPSRANLDVKEGDVIVARMKDTRKVLLIDNTNSDLIVSTGFLVLRPSEELDSRYLAYYLISNCFQSDKDKLCTGATQKAINNANFKKLEIPLPPISTQRKIAEASDKIENILRKRKITREKTDLLIKSRFNQLFGDLYSNTKGWNFMKFGEVINVLTDYHANGSYEILKEHVELLDNEDYALMIRTTDLEKENYDKGNKYITKEAYEFLEKSKVFGGEIVINKIGSAGNVYLMPDLHRPVSLGMNAFLLRFKDNVDPRFIYYILTSPYGERELKRRVKGAVTKTIRKDAIRDIDIPVPPIGLQKQFAADVEHVVDNLKFQDEQINKTEILLRSFL